MIVYFLKGGPDFLVPVGQVEHLPDPGGLLQRHDGVPGIGMGSKMRTLRTNRIPARIAVGSKFLLFMKSAQMGHKLE